MGNSSCHVFGFSENEIKDGHCDLVQVATDEKLFPIAGADALPPTKVAEVRAIGKGPCSPRTMFRPTGETRKALKMKQDRSSCEDRWSKVKAEWEAKVMAEMQEQEHVSQSPATEPERFGADERMRVLAAIREEEEERQRAEIERKANSGVHATDAQISAENANSDVASTEPLLAPADEENNAVQESQCQGVEAAATENTQCLEEDVAQQKADVDSFLAKNGFDGVNTKRRRALRPSICPLHLAAERGDARLVSALLLAGADALQKDSSGRTPADVAKRKNRKCSHDEVLALLSPQ